MRHHAERVHAGVGATRTMHAGLARKKFAQGLLDLLLHAEAGFLRLPAFVIRAVVSDGQFEFERIHMETRPQMHTDEHGWRRRL